MWVGPLLSAMAAQPPVDWLLVHAEAATQQFKTTFTSSPSTPPYKRGGALLRLSNGLIERNFFAGADGAFCTVEYRHLRTQQTFFRAIAPEGNLTLNGTGFDIGGCAGQPDGHNEFFTPETYAHALALGNRSLVFVNATQEPPAPLFDWTPGTRHSPRDVAWPPRGVHLIATFVPPPTAPAALRGAVVRVHYEMYDGMPVLRKWVEVAAGDAPQPVSVDTLVYEMLRAPNFAPEHMSIVQQQYNNPVPADDQTRGGSFGRDFSLWFADADYDACCDQELHVPYTLYTRLLVGYTASAAYGGPTGPGAVVTPHGASFHSLSLRTILHDSLSAERVGLGIREMHRRLAPHLLENPINLMATDISTSAAFTLAIDQAAETGHEILIVGFGAKGWCGLCFSQLRNQSFRGWFKAHVAYAAKRGVEVSGYTLMQHNGWGESIPLAEQTLGRDLSTRGPTACFATDWHAGYRAAVLDFVEETRMGGLETDGQFEGIPCADKGGDHRHNGIEGGYSYGMAATLEFNTQLKALGAYQTGADGYCFSGANKWNHADTDRFSQLPLWEQMTVGRMYIYDSTFARLPTSGQIGVNDLAETSKACAVVDRVGCFDFVLGTQYLMGTIPTFRSASLFAPADPNATALQHTISKWTSFYKRYRALRPSGRAGVLVDKLLHLRRPDSRSLEAVAHLTSDDSDATRAILSVVNPTPAATSAALELPLYYAGIAQGSRVALRGIDLASPSGRAAPTAAREEHVVGAEGVGPYSVLVEVKLPPRSYSAYIVELLSESSRPR